ncbi:hypothetical protein VTL71DRAFT_5349 [Oculimacula yallundae]|uniref:Membrane fusion mating protein FIG1 n=1 Tax=Oculimacula yallundae TaxID=86028 RepID=A0ABR4C2H9_9HELO
MTAIFPSRFKFRRDLMSFLGYHHVLMVFLSIAIITTSIVVAGCTTPSLANVYLLSLRYLNSSTSTTSSTHPEQLNPNISATFHNISDHPSLEVRAGYLGLCVRQNSEKWHCSRSAPSLVEIVELSRGSKDDPLNLLWIASNFRSQVVFVGLIFISIALSVLAIVLLSTFPRWHTETDDDGSEREVKPFPSKKISYSATALIGLASIFMFVSILWQHIVSATAAVMVDDLTYGAAKGSVGSAAMAIGWTAVSCLLLTFVATLIMVWSIKVLSELVD